MVWSTSETENGRFGATEGSSHARSRSLTAPADRTPFDDVHRLGVLRNADAERVLDFLILDESFPRSIARCALEIGSALDALSPRDDAKPAYDQLVAMLAERPETWTAAMLHDRLGQITGALDQLHEVVFESHFVSRTHEIAAV